MRLTNKASGFIPENAQKYRNAENITHKQIVDKLGQLEDVEDELGVELLTLFKALKDGVYIKRQTQYTYPLALLRKHFTNGKTRYYVYDGGKEKEIKLKDYSKTWALTKEELE